MTIDEARKILDNDGINLSDADIQKDIETAELLKNMFFSLINKNMRIKNQRAEKEDLKKAKSF